jgi:alpha-tubulin suppressor-like RCC1 family protein
MTRLLLLLVVAVSWRELPAAASPALSAGEVFSCVVDGGRVACWGFNRHGQLGDGTYVQRAAPARVVGITDAVQVASGVDHACAVRKTGAVMCWGDNTHGQLGDGSTTDRLKPVVVAGLSDAVEVAAGHAHSCARRRSGAVACWGSNAAGQLGDGTRTDHRRPVAVAGLTRVAEISAGGDDSCARLTDGKVACWGTDARGETGTPPSRRTMDVFEIVVGNWDGPKGGGDLKETVYAQTRPRLLAIDDAIAISVGASASCAARSNGRVTCWGTNTFAQLGSKDSVEAGTFVDVPDVRDATGISIGFTHACARIRDGSVMCWGDFDKIYMQNGQKVQGSKTLAPTPIAGITDADEVSVGIHHSCVRRASHKLACWGMNEVDQLGTGLVVNDDLGELPNLTATAIVVGVVDACAITTQGHVACFGEQDAVGTPVKPHELAGISDAVAISGTGRHHCIVRRTGKVACWGDGSFAPLGDGTTDPNETPVEVAKLDDVVEIVAGFNSSCARRRAGEVWCWGSNPNGWLGTGTAADPQLVPAKVDGLVDPVELGVGSLTGCARERSGRVQCWGGNDDGAVGDGTTTDRKKPVPVAGLTDAIALAVGSQHACAVRKTHDVVCWGSAADGATGNGKPVGGKDLRPVKVVDLSDVVAISADMHTCAVTSAGRVYCWGANNTFQLGHGSGPDVSRPQDVVGLTDVVTVSAGFQSSCALTKTGRVMCWELRNMGAKQLLEITDKPIDVAPIQP